MKLTGKLGAYLVLVHGAVLLTIYVFLLTGERLWLALGAFICVASLAWSLRYAFRVLGTVELIRSGADFIAEGDFSVRLQPIGQPDADRVIGVYNQMIDRLREERVQFQEQNLFLHKLVEASPTGIIILDLDGTIHRMNPAAQSLFAAFRADIGQGCRLEESQSRLASELAALLPGTSKVAVLGGRRRFKCHKDDFVDRGFRRQFLLIEELTDELRRSEKAAYEQLIRLMSHEVNNTVAATSSLLESCREYAVQLSSEDRVDFESALEISISRARDLNGFVRGFADVVRIPDPRRKPSDVQVLLEDVIYLMGPELEKRRIRCECGMNDRMPVMVELDRVQMEQVLVNVFKNAIEAIGEDGTIEVRLGRTDGQPWIQIEDSGGGIAAGERDRLFTPFYSTKQDGNGLGLTMAREILENHGFDYSLDSDPGSGARFTIRFS